MSPLNGTIDTAPDTIFNRAVLLLLELNRLGVNKKVPSAAAATAAGADPELVHVSKEILSAPSLKAIGSYQGEIKRMVRERSTQSPMFNGGVYLLSNAMILDVDAKLQDAITYHDEVLVPAFMAEYESLKDAARVRLGSLFNLADYPPADRVRAKFVVRYQYLSVNTPETLTEIKAELFEREKSKAAAEWLDAMNECRNVLRVSFADLVDHMADRLSPDADGKRKVFRDSLVSNFRDFLTSFTAWNLTDDGELTVLVDQAKALLCGVDPDTLRKSDASRDYVAARIAEIKTRLDTMTMDRPTRRYQADTEE